MTGPAPSSVYEIWVTTLRAWSVDPSTPLAELPILTEDSLPRGAFDRLFEHLHAALEKSTTTWVESFSHAMGDFSDDHDLADRLIKLRIGLARRMQLASHPSLPDVVRQSLSEDFERFVRTAQEELEASIRDGLRARQASQEHETRMLRTTRENSLVGVLNLRLSQDGSRGAVAPLPPTDEMALPAPAPTRRRRAIIHD